MAGVNQTVVSLINCVIKEDNTLKGDIAEIGHFEGQYMVVYKDGQRSKPIPRPFIDDFALKLKIFLLKNV